MNATHLQLFDVRELLNAEHEYLLEDQPPEVTWQFRALVLRGSDTSAIQYFKELCFLWIKISRSDNLAKSLTTLFANLPEIKNLIILIFRDFGCSGPSTLQSSDNSGNYVCSELKSLGVTWEPEMSAMCHLKSINMWHIVNSNLVQYLLQTDIQKRYNGKYKHYTEIFHLETQTRKTNIYYIHTLCYVVYNTIYI
jgi:hypothetical protein